MHAWSGIPKEVALSPDELAATIRRHAITTMFVTTALFNQIAHAKPDTFAPMKTVLFGGEAVDPRSVQLVLGRGAPQRILHVYGPTETTTFATWHLVEHVEADARTIPIGRPISNTQVYVLNDALQPAPIGVPGELYIGGDGLARGLSGPSRTHRREIHPQSLRPRASLQDR